MLVRSGGVQHIRPLRVVLLIVVLALAAWLIIAGPAARDAPPQAGGSPTAPQPALTQRWPDARITTIPGRLADGTPFTPALAVDQALTVGTAPTPDGSGLRLLVRDGTGTRELRRVGNEQEPQFLGFTRLDADVFWAESTATADGTATTRIWRAPARGDAPATIVAADAGDMVFFGSQYDLVIAEGRLHWVAAARQDEPVTEVRSAPLGGGPQAIKRIPGPHSMSGWPWLLTAGDPGAPTVLVNHVTAERRPVPRSAGELVRCSPMWCRAVVTGDSGNVNRIDVMRPDGSDRRRMAGSGASAALADVALRDRFEVLSQGVLAAPGESGQRLVLYDLSTNELTTIADGVGIVQANGGMLWWSTGDPEVAEWHILDTSTLS